jgi:hypothetical protein
MMQFENPVWKLAVRLCILNALQRPVLCALQYEKHSTLSVEYLTDKISAVQTV